MAEGRGDSAGGRWSPDSRFRFLIVGSGRSGTSLLAGMLGAHSAIDMGFEVGGVDYLRGRALATEHPNVFNHRAGGFLSACEREAAASAAPIWGNKVTTEQLSGLNKHNLYAQPPLDVLDAFFNGMLAGLPLIHLLRDGRACVASKLRRTPQSLEQACDSWKYAVTVYQFLQKRPDTLFLRFEELLADPRRELQRVLDVLGLAFEARMVSSEGTMSPTIPPVYRREGIDPARAAVDARHPCVPLIAEQLAACDYL
jgi:hypothetical protein